jgi:nitroimidazol reductase NimA-like FMN-containing flavoprotein (pyridoxamine 5'-phosphate oxidase superfamily)
MKTDMSAVEVEQFLASQRTLTLVTLRPDGSPVAHPLWFTQLEQSIYVDTRADSLKYKNILHDARVCVVVEAGESYFELRGVRVEGRCEAVTDTSEVALVQAAIAQKDAELGSGVSEMPAWFSKNRQQRRGRGERVILRIPMERVYSWDFGKVREHYASDGSD